jgi:hypothetical protein
MPIRNMMDEVIAQDAASLWDGDLDKPILYDENSDVHEVFVWTGTNPDGSSHDDHCDDWDGENNSRGRLAYSEVDTAQWISADWTWCASFQASIYCLRE